jgi:hypothetical protein
MSHIATNYLKDLAEAPQGASIKGTQWAILRFLALSHNDKVGSAWPSMKGLAKHCGISERYCRVLIERLERMGIIKRVYTRNRKSGGQSSNFFTFPAIADSSAKLFENLNQVVRVPRAPMSRTRRIEHPSQSDGGDLGRRTHTTVPPGHAAPPIESLGESLSESVEEALKDPSARPDGPTSLGNVKQNQILPTKTADQCCDLSLGQQAWDRAVTNLHQSLFPGSQWAGRATSISGAKDWKSFRLEKVNVLSIERCGFCALLMTVRSPNPKSAARGFKLHQTHLEESLRKFYGVSVALKLNTGR